MCSVMRVVFKYRLLLVRLTGQYKIYYCQQLTALCLGSLKLVSALQLVFRYCLRNIRNA